MIVVDDKSKCTGCSACYAVCPKHCIVMCPDEEGYLYPSIDISSCVNCGVCEKVCPVRKPITVTERKTLAFAVQNKDEIIRSQSASGGAFSAFAETILEKQGVVFGGCFDKNFHVIHEGVTSLDDLGKLRCSKYVQSYMGDTFIKVKKLLEDDRQVLFSGTPCQVYGLKSFLRRDYKNLITIDLVCRGTPSPGLWKKYLQWVSYKKKSNITSVSFRDKHYGYAGSTMAIGFDSGKIEYRSRDVQFFKYTFFQDLNNRPSCFKCHFKTIKRDTDITLYDCWHVDKFDKNMDDDLGTTMVLIHTEKGNRLFNEIKSLVRYCKADVKKAIGLDGIMAVQCPAPNPQRAQFFNDINNMEYDDLMDKYFPLSYKKSIIQFFKPILYRLGILNKLKRILG